jgi:hypothetical protein
VTVADPRGPALRATFVRHLLDECDLVPEAARIRARVPSDVLARVTHAHRGAFVAGADNQAVVDAVCAELTEERALEVFRRQVTSFGNSPVMAATVRSLLRLFGSTPHVLLRHSVRLREAAVRGFGHYEYVRTGETSGTLQMRDYPRELMKEAAWLMLRGSSIGIVEVTGRKAEGLVVVHSEADGTLDVELTWCVQR